LEFRLEKTDAPAGARAGVLKTAHGVVETPSFMPVGTQGTVKTVSPHELEDAGVRMVLANTYHLVLRPGDALVREAGGLHAFMGWPRPILTDSGGFQVFSLAGLRKITDDGVRFQSHLDGSTLVFTPESVVDVQRNLGSDVMMVLDECVAYPCTREDAAGACARTLHWAVRSKRRAEESEARAPFSQGLFGIGQGSTHPDLRRSCMDRLVEIGFDGYAIGGLAVGEPKQTMMEAVALSAGLMPPDKPRYLMGVGKPEDIVEAIALGIDLFDCVIPTRNARNGTVYTRQGKRVVKNAEFAVDFRPIETSCSCYACRFFSRAYLRHLFQAGEILGLRLTTIHNLHFYMALMQEARQAVVDGRFQAWKKAFFNVYYGGNESS